MKQTFFKIKFDEKLEIDYDMFREINEIVGKIRFEGFGKILAPRYEYYNSNEDIVNELGNKLYMSLYVMHGDDKKLRDMIRKDIKKLGYDYSYTNEMPDFIEIFYNSHNNINNTLKFENDLKTKIMEFGGDINKNCKLKNNYDSSISFRLRCPTDCFEKNLNKILDFIETNIGEEYFIEYF